MGIDLAAPESTGSVQKSREHSSASTSTCCRPPPLSARRRVSASATCCRRWRWPSRLDTIVHGLSSTELSCVRCCRGEHWQVPLVSPPRLLHFRCESKSSLFACFILGSNLLAAKSLVCSEQQHSAGLDPLT